MTNLSVIAVYQYRIVGYIESNIENREQCRIGDIGSLCSLDVDQNMANTIFLHEGLEAIRELFRDKCSKVTDISIITGEMTPKYGTPTL